MNNMVRQRESRVEEGHLRPDYVHMLVSIPPKYAVSDVVGYVKGKRAIYIARDFVSRRRNLGGEKFWARGYYVPTIGGMKLPSGITSRSRTEEDRRLDQMNLF